MDSGIPTFEQCPGLRDKLMRDFAEENPAEYMKTIMSMTEKCLNASQNPAHKAIAESGFQVITMNIDGLHGDDALEVHGRIPNRLYDIEDEMEEFFENDNIILYGNAAPNYTKAIKMVKDLPYGRGYFIIVGTSFYTGISNILYECARKRKAHIIIINENASEKVPTLCDRLKNAI